jgi:hypothetical protein
MEHQTTLLEGQMANTCIVCGQAAGSGEHVFPAALGGRRINKNIYCTTHDNGYSSLVAYLANQVDVLNALLGVVPDHSNDVRSVITRDAHTGQELKLSTKESKFTAPRVISRQQDGNGTRMEMAFPDYESMNQWLAGQKAKGLDVAIDQKAEVKPYFLGEVHFQRQFGGFCGLGAVAYVTQTFLAQAFANLARSNEVVAFIAYTQAIAKVAQISGGCTEDTVGQSNPKLEQAQRDLEASLAVWGGQAPVWLDFDPQPDTTPNAFEFGHRVTVGIDAADGQIFGRFSLFSSIHFSMCFGKAISPTETKTVTIDIDPMAAHPPNDIKKTESIAALARVSRPSVPTAELKSTISSKAQERVLSNLLQRIGERSLATSAKEMHADLVAYPSMSPAEGDELLRRLVDGQSQRVWNLATWVLKDFKSKLPAPTVPIFGPMIDSMVAHDPSAPNGLSVMANATLELAKDALIAQMREDVRAGRLDERRLAALMGEDAGAAVVGKLVLASIEQALLR